MRVPLRVLMVEDSEDDALLLARCLRQGGYDVTWQRVDSAKAMAEALAGQTWDVILADYTLPGFGGRDALRLVTERGLDIPFIVVSGTIGEEAAVDIMKAGAHDFVRKGNLARLVPVIEREMREARERQAHRRAEFERELILSSAGEGIVGLDREGRILFINPAAARMLGWSAEELVGHSLHGTAHHHRADGSPFPWEECAARDTALHGTIHHVDEELFWRRDGTSFPVEFISTPIREEGELAGVVVVFRDITERKRVERELNQAHQSLLNAEVEKKRFYREVIRAVTQDKLHLVDAGEIPIKGQCILQVDLTDIEGYRSLRKRLRDVALDAGMDPEDAEDLVLGVGEAVINAVKHGREGRAEIYTAPGCIIARVSDRGEGIRAEQIPATILLPGYSTQISLGMGFTIMLQVMDRVWLATGPEGTTIQLERSLLAQERDRRIPPPAWHKL